MLTPCSPAALDPRLLHVLRPLLWGAFSFVAHPFNFAPLPLVEEETQTSGLLALVGKIRMKKDDKQSRKEILFQKLGISAFPLLAKKNISTY